jgi:uncharacterized protein (DUF1778 family)
MDRNGARSTRLEMRLSPETLALVLRLTLADQRALADALGTPPKPAPALRHARTAHRRLIAATR